MSVQNQTVKNVYAGNGSTTVFPYTFALNTDDGEYVGVYVTNDAGTSETTDNFTIDTTAKTVTYPATGNPLESGKKITIKRELPNEQNLNLENLGPFFAEDIESELDRLVMMIQQLAEEADRAVKVDMASDHTPEEFLQDIADAVETAKGYADDAQDSADAADASVTKAAKWAEGSDADVSALGGTHSSKGWSDVSKGHSDDASGYATAASGSATAASGSETNASYWAEGTDGQVTPLGGTHSAKGWAAEAQTSADAAAAAASTVVAAHNNSPNAHADLLHLRQNNKVYAASDIAFSASLPSYLVLECTTPGTTAATEPDFSGAVEGGTVTDGTVVWTYKTLVGGGLPRELIPAFNKRDVITTSGTYTAPVTGWYKITVKGGGGGGSKGIHNGTTGTSGAGGGEGGTTIAFEYMTAGDTATVTIGAGGTGANGAELTAGTNGGDSSVIVNANTYTGGGGQCGGYNTSMDGGEGGTGTIKGAAGNPTTKSYQSTAAGGSGGGAGGGVCVVNGTAISGVNGGGGAGGYCTYNAAAGNGSDGGDGYAWFEYFDGSLNP